MTDDASRNWLFVLGRALFGGIVAFMGLNGFQNAEEQAQYAASKDIPKPTSAVLFSHGMLVAGGLGVVFWKLPVAAAGAVATFFAGVTPTMHDFWNADEDQQQQEMINFLKNTALLGGALALLSRGANAR